MPRRPPLHLIVEAMLAAGLVAIATTGCSSLAGAEPVSSTRSWSVVGYAEAGSTPVSSLDADRAELTTIGIDGINVARGGATVEAVSTDALQLLQHAHARHRPADLLVGNFDARLGDFSPAIGDALLGSTSHISAVTSSLAREVRRHRWDGVTIDLESLSGSHPAGLTRFVTMLKQKLGPHHDVSICLMATPGDYADLGYDLRALGRSADRVVLMAYDQHGPTWSEPGPVGGSPWVEASLDPLLRTIPRHKIELGVAGYGYTWPAHGVGTQLSDAAARAMAKRNATWDARQQEWHATTRTGTSVWWSDARTIEARAAYARSLGLGGIAVWSLGLSDPLPHHLR